MTTKKTKIEHADIVRRFAERLKEKRLALGLTQAELAKRSDVTLNYIGRLEAAGAAPGIDLLSRLAEALGTTPADLLPFAPPPDPAEVLARKPGGCLRRWSSPPTETRCCCLCLSWPD